MQLITLGSTLRSTKDSFTSRTAERPSKSSSLAFANALENSVSIHRYGSGCCLKKKEKATYKLG